MKTFFKWDFYIQITVFIIFIIVATIYSVYDDAGVWFLFYFVVGGVQLISFFIRCIASYKKNWAFIAYGFFILPVWLTLLLAITGINEIGYVFIIPAAAVFYSPFFALFYLFYCYETFDHEEFAF